MRPRRPWVWGLENYGLTKTSLREMGTRPVTAQIEIPIAPHVYPSLAQYRTLVELSPDKRRTLIREWREDKHRRLVRELPTREYETIRFNRAPVGVRVVLPANSIHRLFNLRHAESVRIEAIAGRKPRRTQTEKPRLFAVKARFSFQVEGQTKGTQLHEERIFVLVAKSETTAKRLATKTFRGEESPSLLVSGRYSRWHFEEILEVCESVDGEFNPRGTEVYYSYRSRRMRPENEWHPLRNRTKPSRRRRTKTRRA